VDADRDREEGAVPIKSNVQARYFTGKVEEFRAASKFAADFEITFAIAAKDHLRSDAVRGIGVWFAKPHTKVCEQYGLNLELPVLYSDRNTIDAREIHVLDTFVGDPSFRTRLDHMVSFLIHDLPDADGVARFIREESQSLIIPIPRQELMNAPADFVERRLGEHLRTINLFDLTSPIQSASQFFGRESLVVELAAKTKSGNCGLFGLRKTGKTSILFALRRHLDGTGRACEYVDFQNPGAHSLRWWSALELVASRFKARVEGAQDAEVRLGRYDENNAGLQFISDLQGLLRRNDEISSLTAMFDEIEWITPRLAGVTAQHWDQDFVAFAGTLRAAHHELDGRFTFIVAGVNPSALEESHFQSAERGPVQNPVFQVASPYYVEPMTDASVKEMLQGIGRYCAVRFEDPVFGYLTERYGGHPLLIRLAVAEVVSAQAEQPPTGKTVSSLRIKRPMFHDDVADRIRERLSQSFRDILLSLIWWYPDEFDVLQILASGDEAFATDYLANASSARRHFERYGLLRGAEFAMQDMQYFLQVSGEAYKNEMSPFVRGELAQDRLPEVPDLRLLGRLFEKKAKLEIGLRKAIVLYVGVKQNWSQPKMARSIAECLPTLSHRPRPMDLFIGRDVKDAVQELFVPDMEAVVTKNWDTFRGLFRDKLRFEQAMKDVNLARRVDSHTLPISEEECEAFEASYNWLLAKLKDLPD